MPPLDNRRHTIIDASWSQIDATLKSTIIKHSNKSEHDYLIEDANFVGIKIGVDIDDTLSETVQGFVEFYFRVSGKRFHRHDFYTYRWHELLGLSLDEFVEFIRQFYHSDEFNKLTPVAEAQTAIAHLSKDKSLIAVTSRWGDCINFTQPWLQNYFPEISEVHFCKNFVFDKRQPENTVAPQAVHKADICTSLGVQVLIEDVIEEAFRCGEAGVPVILLDRPWNQGELPETARRVFSWSEVPEVIEELI